MLLSEVIGILHMKHKMSQYRNILLYAAGLLIVCLSLIPYFVLGEDVWVFFHDQLDGEVLNYIYQAKYLFRSSHIPELMNGIPGTGMLPPAPFGVFFYAVCSPFAAYVWMQALVTFTAYTGMFLLLCRITKDGRIAFLCGCLFAYLPFMPVYGLSIVGIPLLIYAFWNLYRNQKRILSVALIIFYAGFSSFALIGYGVCAIAAVAVIFLFISAAGNGKKPAEKGSVLSGMAALYGTYLCCNASLFGEILLSGTKGGEVFRSHREEIVQTAVTDYGNELHRLLFGDAVYAPAFAEWILALTVLLAVLCLASKKKELLRIPLLLLGGMFGVAFLALFWKSPLCMASIRQFGPLRYFQADRISWMLPPAWYVLLGMDFRIICSLKDGFGEKKERRKRIAAAVAAYGSILLFCGFCTGIIYKNSFFYHQIRQMVFPDTYKIMTWNQFYAGDIMEQIEAYIKEKTGHEKAEYRVASLGMSPAPALYHGFYCLDGYSNNYSLSYKHTFRRIIAKELARDEGIRRYFDEWGNRCYIMSAESGTAPMISKYQASVYEDLQLDTQAFSELGGKYLFSAMEIKNCKDVGFVLEDVFETPSSYYKVYLYRLEKEAP